MTTIRIDPADAERVRRDLRHVRDGMPLVVMRSINRVLSGVRTDFVSSVRREYNVKARAARGNIRIRRASRDNLSGEVRSTGKPIPLVEFDVRPSNVQPRRRVPITVEVIRGERKPVEHAFVAVMASGHKGVFRRHKRGGERVGRLPIGELWGPRLEDYYARPEVQLDLQRGADRRLSIEIERQTDYLFRQRMGLL